jgi:hypothetical protein
MTVFCEGTDRGDRRCARAKKVSGLGRWYNLVRDARRDTALTPTGSVTIRRQPGTKRPGKTPPDANGTDREGS